VRHYVGQAWSPSVASCAELVQELRAQGSNTVADYLEGSPVYDPDYTGELNAITAVDPNQRDRIDSCVYLRSTDTMSAAAASLSADEAAALASYEQAKLAEATAGKPGQTGYSPPGQGLSAAGAYAQAQAKIDAQGDPLGWIKGSFEPFGVPVPKWVVWAGLGFLAYSLTTGYGKGRASQ
jgi:uncharacterized membrane protein